MRTRSGSGGEGGGSVGARARVTRRNGVTGPTVPIVRKNRRLNSGSSSSSHSVNANATSRENVRSVNVENEQQEEQAVAVDQNQNSMGSDLEVEFVSRDTSSPLFPLVTAVRFDKHKTNDQPVNSPSPLPLPTTSSDEQTTISIDSADNCCLLCLKECNLESESPISQTGNGTEVTEEEKRVVCSRFLKLIQRQRDLQSQMLSKTNCEQLRKRIKMAFFRKMEEMQKDFYFHCCVDCFQTVKNFCRACEEAEKALLNVDLWFFNLKSIIEKTPNRESDNVRQWEDKPLFGAIRETIQMGTKRKPAVVLVPCNKRQRREPSTSSSPVDNYCDSDNNDQRNTIIDQYQITSSLSDTATPPPPVMTPPNAIEEPMHAPVFSPASPSQGGQLHPNSPSPTPTDVASSVEEREMHQEGNSDRISESSACTEPVNHFEVLEERNDVTVTPPPTPSGNVSEDRQDDSGNVHDTNNNSNETEDRNERDVELVDLTDDDDSEIQENLNNTDDNANHTDDINIESEVLLDYSAMEGETLGSGELYEEEESSCHGGNPVFNASGLEESETFQDVPPQGNDYEGEAGAGDHRNNNNSDQSQAPHSPPVFTPFENMNQEQDDSPNNGEGHTQDEIPMPPPPPPPQDEDFAQHSNNEQRNNASSSQDFHFGCDGSCKRGNFSHRTYDTALGLISELRIEITQTKKIRLAGNHSMDDLIATFLQSMNRQTGQTSHSFQHQNRSNENFTHPNYYPSAPPPQQNDYQSAYVPPGTSQQPSYSFQEHQFAQDFGNASTSANAPSSSFQSPPVYENENIVIEELQSEGLFENYQNEAYMHGGEEEQYVEEPSQDGMDEDDVQFLN